MATKEQILTWLEEVKDPEIPVLSLIDLGVITEVSVAEADGKVTVEMTPTFSGCPAMDVISMDIRLKLIEKGFRNVSIKQQLSPAWTTDWMSEEGKRKLKEYGIAPPNPRQQVCNNDLFAPHEAVQCPQCNSYHIHRISEFGSTACKALYQCDDCKEPFDYFKCH